MKVRLFVLSLITALGVFLFGYTVLADEVTINEERIYVEITSEGIVKIYDNLVYDVTGSLNGFYKNISYDKADAIRINKVQEAINPQKVNTDFEDYELVDEAQKGDKGVYTLEAQGDDVTVRMYSPFKDGFKGFRIGYELSGAMNKYKDVAEFYWKFVDESNETAIKRLEIYLTYPEGSTKDTIRAYAHGPLNGDVKILDDRTAIFTVDNVDSNTLVEIRALMPSELLASMDYTIEEQMLDKIVSEEQGYIKEIEKEEAKRKETEQFGKLSPLIVIVLNAIAGMFMIFKLRTPKYNQYEREAINIEAYDPVTLCYYAAPYSTNITNGLLGELLNLVRKGFLIIEPQKEEISSEGQQVHGNDQAESTGSEDDAQQSDNVIELYNNVTAQAQKEEGSENEEGYGEDEADYKAEDDLEQEYLEEDFEGDEEEESSEEYDEHEEDLDDSNPWGSSRVIRTDKQESLRPAEEFLINWFIDDIGDGSSVNLKEIAEYFRNNDEAVDKMMEWDAIISDEIASYGYTDSSKKKYKPIIAAVAITGIVISIIAIIYGNTLGIGSLLLSIGLLVTILTFNNRSEKGQKAYDNFRYVKDKLKSLGEQDAKELIENMRQGELLMVYAALLNLKDDYIEKMSSAFGDNYEQSTYEGYYLWHCLYWGDFSDSLGLTDSIDNAIRLPGDGASTSTDYTHNDQGFGGSFSSGDGGGSSGGGGGAGGF